MTSPAHLTQGLQLLDALQQVQGDADLAQTPEALKARLATLCAHQHLTATSAQLDQAVALYQTQHAATVPALSHPKAPTEAPSPSPWGGLRAFGWSLTAVGSGLVGIAVANALGGLFWTHGSLGSALIDGLGGGMAWLGLLALQQAEGRPARRPRLFPWHLKDRSVGWPRWHTRISTPVAPAPPPVSPWTQGTHCPPMETRGVAWARTTAAETLNLAHPYEGKQQLRLQVSLAHHPDEAVVALLLNRGQFGIVDQVRVRFDDEEAQYWRVDREGTDISPVFRCGVPDKVKRMTVLDAAAFVARMRRAHQVRIEVPFYDNPLYVATFAVADFPLETPEAWATEFQRIQPPLSSEWRVRPPQADGVRQWELASTHAVWVEGTYDARFVRLECHVRLDRGEARGHVGLFLPDVAFSSDEALLEVENCTAQTIALHRRSASQDRPHFLHAHRYRHGMYAWLDQSDAVRQALVEGQPFTVQVRLRGLNAVVFRFEPPAMAAGELGLSTPGARA